MNELNPEDELQSKNVLSKELFYRFQLANELYEKTRIERVNRELSVKLLSEKVQTASLQHQLAQLQLRLDNKLKIQKEVFEKEIDHIEKTAGFKIRGMGLNEETLEVLSDEDMKNRV